MRRILLLAVFLAFLIQPGRAQAADTCHSAAYHQFDFFVGSWSVTTQAGKKIGTDEVTKEYGGCVIVEKWHDAGDPGGGIGLTGYQIGRKTWHQDFMDDGGFVLSIDGALIGTQMIMRGTDYPSDGKSRLHRVTWTPRRDGSVEELWKTSDDGGKTWRVHFDGIFRRM